MTGEAEQPFGDQAGDLAIAREDPRQAGLRPLIQALDDYLTALYPPLKDAFSANVPLNGLILGQLLTPTL